MNPLAPIFVAATAAGTALPPLPLSSAEPLLTYMGCLFEPVRAKFKDGLPADKSSRENAVEEIIQGCSSTRTSVSEAAFERSETLPTVTEQNERKALIEAYLSRFDEQLRFMIVENEKALEAERQYEACLERGESEC